MPSRSTRPSARQHEGDVLAEAAALKARPATVTNAKNILRAAQAVASKSLTAPHFIHRSPDLARHRRKCSVCHHPEREAIEDLFVHWHSPEAIASFYDDGDEELNEKAITWISIYRHAYAFGLDEIRRRNLRFVFEHILDQAGTIAATPASIILAARALASCVNENGDWNEPPKRVIVTNIIRNEPPQSAPASTPASPASVGADSFHRPAPPETSGNPSSRACPERSRRASQQRDVFPLAGEGDAPASVSPAFVGADSLHRPAPPEASNNPFSSAETQERPASSEETDSDRRSSSFRALHPREVGDSLPASPPPGLSASDPSPEIRNSLNSFNSKEPPISNR